MNLSDYQWSRNPRGLHDPGDNHQRWDMWKMGWIKTVYVDNGGLQWAAHALEKGMTPITRIYRPQFSGVPMDDYMRGQFIEHLNLGVKWFEFYNEPNLPDEWPENVDLRPDNMDLIRPLCDNWLPWAEFIIERGGYPGFIALAENSAPWGMTTFWLNNILRYMFDTHYERFRNIIANGMWLSTHPYIFNHWYQEEPGNPLLARPRDRVNYAEGGWHFEYPYDPISQADDPGRTVWGGTPTEPNNDVYGVLGSGIAWLERLQEMFGVGWIPVVGTEGGIAPLPEIPGEVEQLDTRYPGYDFTAHAHGTVAMFDWVANQAPGWMFGICLWREADYWRNGDPIPALNYLADTPGPYKSNVPSYPALGQAPRPYGDGQIASAPPPDQSQPTQAAVAVVPPTATPLPVTAVPSGPGPIHGAPDYHFVVLAPGFNENWFFDSAGVRAYWERFLPTLMSNFEFIDFLPYDRSLVVTAITTPELLEYVNSQIARRWPNIWMDVVLVSTPTEVNTEFEERARTGLRYG